MDFGKMAYLRVEEIENILRQQRPQRIRNTAFTLTPNASIINVDSLPRQDFRVSEAEGTGRVTFLVKILAEVQIGFSGEIQLWIDGHKAGFTSLDTAGTHERTIVVSVPMTQLSSLTLRASIGFRAVLRMVTVCLIGENVRLIRPRGNFAIDQSGETIAVIHSREDDRIIIHRGSKYDNAIVFVESFVGTGSVADVCSDNNGGFFVAYSDNDNNMWLVHFLVEGSVRRVRICDGRADSIAVFLDFAAVVVAFIRDRRLHFILVDEGLGSVSSPKRLEDEIRVEHVAFTKNALSPTLLLENEGKVFLRQSIPTLGIDGKSMNMQVHVRGQFT